jgi:predicted dehydrogenase
MVSARLHFASGAVANLTASRTSYQPLRSMQVFTASQFASIDFAARKSTVVTPRSDVLRREFQQAKLGEDDRARLRERLFEELLVTHEQPAVEANAIEQELIDFAEAIRTGRQPRVSGADGRDAVAVAEAVLAEVQRHAWDGAEGRLVGPLALPMGRALPPMVADDSWSTEDTVILRRKAG